MAYTNCPVCNIIMDEGHVHPPVICQENLLYEKEQLEERVSWMSIELDKQRARVKELDIALAKLAFVVNRK
jgi:hypothetical protein